MLKGFLLSVSRVLVVMYSKKSPFAPHIPAAANRDLVLLPKDPRPISTSPPPTTISCREEKWCDVGTTAYEGPNTKDIRIATSEFKEIDSAPTAWLHCAAVYPGSESSANRTMKLNVEE